MCWHCVIGALQLHTGIVNSPERPPISERIVPQGLINCDPRFINVHCEHVNAVSTSVGRLDSISWIVFFLFFFPPHACMCLTSKACTPSCACLQVPTDVRGLTFNRSPQQVLGITGFQHLERSSLRIAIVHKPCT